MYGSKMELKVDKIFASCATEDTVLRSAELALPSDKLPVPKIDVDVEAGQCYLTKRTHTVDARSSVTQDRRSSRVLPNKTSFSHIPCLKVATARPLHSSARFSMTAPVAHLIDAIPLVSFE
jgi:hypothetical protein